jgi:AcrR family transcriptional regulator
MGLREAKKRQTRQSLSEIATRLFAAHGFDRVTIAEIAAAANVSKMTVFNYFPRKEDLLFDRQEEAQELLEGAVRGRQPGETAVAALRRLALTLLAQRHPLSGLRDGSEWFWKIVEESPSLLSRVREVREELERALALALALDSTAGLDPFRCELLAGSIITAFGIVHRAAQRRLRAGELSEAIYPDLVARVNELFDQIEHGVHWSVGRSPGA